MAYRHDKAYDYEMTLVGFSDNEIEGMRKWQRTPAARELKVRFELDPYNSMFRWDTDGVLVIHVSLLLDPRPFRRKLPLYGAILWAPNETTQGALNVARADLSRYYRVISDGQWQTLFANMCPKQWGTADAAIRFLDDHFSYLANYGQRVQGTDEALHQQLMRLDRIMSPTAHLSECGVCRDIWAMHVLPQLWKADRAVSEIRASLASER